VFVRAPHPWGWEGFDDYQDLGRALARGEPFPTIDRPWGYAYFLAAFYRTFGDRPQFPIVAQVVVNAFMPLLTIMMAEVPAADAGVASGVANVTMQVGAALGLAALGTLSADRARDLMLGGDTLTAALTGGYQLGFSIAAAVVAGGLLVALIALRAAPRPRALPEHARESVAEAA